VIVIGFVDVVGSVVVDVVAVVVGSRRGLDDGTHHEYD
jgi:hypothetical protein